MRKMTFKTLAAVTGGRIQEIDASREVALSQVQTDSRQLVPGGLFLPLAGEHFDGHDFILEALARGASSSLCSSEYFSNHKEALENKPLVIVEDTLGALRDMARWVIRDSKATVIAITGSTGKTSTKDFIDSALRTTFTTAKTKGNFNNEIGMSLSILSAGADTEIFVLEMGMNHPGEIRRLVDIAPPDIAVITNIGVSHIEFLGSRENILKAKLEITQNMGGEGLLLLNGEDDLLSALVHRDWPFRVETFGEKEHVDHRLESVRINAKNTYDYKLSQIGITLGVYGRHNVLNSAPGVIIGKKLGVDAKAIQSGIEGYRGEKMRLSLQTTPRQVEIINDAYNASVDSYSSALTLAYQLKKNRLALFFGDIFEMGDLSAQGHREVADMINPEETFLILTKGRASKIIGERLLERGIDPACWIHVATFEEAARILNQKLEPGDHLLIKGSRGMAMERVIPLLA
ncbi:MAG: hypothetical protein AVO33_02655 [delta proteobacterium ML8_F1]|nr:MAG: hypothetical protein AVO33_02655 [delta proteobacterium ML8_F1]